MSARSRMQLFYIVIACAVVAAAPQSVAAADEAQDHSQHAGHAQHQMSAQDLATLREKIPLYRSYTDEQINASMGRMRDVDDYLSPAALRGDIGVLALGHGYGDKGDAQFKAGFADIAMSHPTAVGLGMAMMDSSHVQRAVDRLEAAGARTIVVMPTEIGEQSNLTRQWNYLLGREQRSAYLDVPRVRTQAKLVMTRTPTASPIMTDMLVDGLRRISRNPAEEFAVVIAHGPTDEQENRQQLEALAVHANGIEKALGLAGAIAVTLQDDAPTAVRDANVARIRQRIAAEAAAGRRVLVTPVLITGGGFVSMKIRRDLEGVPFEMVDIGLAESPLFPQWVSQTVSAALARK